MDTTTITKAAIVNYPAMGQDLQPGHVIRIRERVTPDGPLAELVVMVLASDSPDDESDRFRMFFVEGVAVMENGVDSASPVCVMVMCDEEAQVIAEMPVSDWSTDYARRAARGLAAMENERRTEDTVAAAMAEIDARPTADHE